jgi:aminoglycoside phosphotransferase family enzyme/predicted kinase
MTQDELHRALESPAAYPFPASTVEVIETHLSRLYFVGERVFKVKKAVDLGFVDFTTLEKRRHACEEEVRLNRRLAPGIYRGVVPIVRDAAGRVHVGGAGEPIEYAVEMERLPAAQMLDRKLERGEIDSERLDQIVALLADFHATAERGPTIDRLAAPDAVAQGVLGNVDESEAAARRLDAACQSAAPCLSPRLAAHLRGAFTRFVQEERVRFERRIAERRIVEGHGDLHAGNLCVLPDRLVAFDRIEFSLPLRCLDVAADLAFLLMDLDRLGFPAFGRDLARRYAQRTGDPELEAMLGFYKAHRACVRGKVAALRGAGSDDAGVRVRARLEALGFFSLAAGYALPPFLIATCGLPGSGKTYVARVIGSPLNALHLQSDFERKRMAGVAPTAHVPKEREAEVYSAAMTDRTYAVLVDEARGELARARRVILDATFASRRQRAQPLALARELGIPFVLLLCRVDETEARRRLTARVGERGQFSDADVAVFERARTHFEPPDEVPASQRLDVGAGVAVEELVAAVIERVLAQLDSAGRLPTTFPLV